MHQIKYTPKAYLEADFTQKRAVRGFASNITNCINITKEATYQ